MTADSLSAVSALLQEMHAGNEEAQNRLIGEVYDDLRRMAGAALGGERPWHSWQPTDLVHEAYVRLFKTDWRPQNRREFFGFAAHVMNRLLVERGRYKDAKKRKGRQIPLDDIADDFERQRLDALDLHEALTRLGEFDEQQSIVVTLRFFYRYTNAETAKLLGVSESAIKNDMRIALAWLHRELGDSKP